LIKTAGKHRALIKVKSGLFKGQKSGNLKGKLYIFFSCQFTELDKSSSARDYISIKLLTPELNPSAQRCLKRYFTGDFDS
jgi:hypothetical protein